jgi:hypothetical protein
MRYIFLVTLISLVAACTWHNDKPALHAPPPVNADTLQGVPEPVAGQPVAYTPPANEKTIIHPTPLEEAHPGVLSHPLRNYEIARLSIGQPTKDSINYWLAFVGLPPNSAFCSAAASVWNEYAGQWHPRSGLARHFITRAQPHQRIVAAKVLRGEVTIPAGAMAVYERGNTIYGHVGIVTQDFTGARGMYISANTSAPGGQGSEFAGGGVYEKPFSFNPGAVFRVSTFLRPY